MITHADVRNDLYNSVNGEWEKTAVIPSDKPRIGGFSDIALKVEELLMQDVKDFANNNKTLNSEYAELFIKYYKLAADYEAREQEGSKDLMLYLEKIKSISSIADLQNIAKDLVLDDYYLPFTMGIGADYNDSSRYALYLGVPRLILPDKTYYTEDNPKKTELLEAYKESVSAYLLALGLEDSEVDDLIHKTIKYDSRLVPLVRSSEENADRSKSNNPRTIAELEAYLKNFSFSKLLAELISEEVQDLIVTEPKYYEELHSVFNDELLEELKAWMFVKFAHAHSDLLSEKLRQLGGKFSLILKGQPELDNQEKASYYLAKSRFGQVLGNYYGETYFGPEARKDVKKMIATMIDVYQERLKNNNWLSQETREQAIYKLSKMTVMVAYPDYYPAEYEFMTVDENISLLENTINLDRATNEYFFKQWHKAVDHSRWAMSADMVNAYFMPSSNLICFPAGILNEPFYSLEQGASKNFGGIGAVIAHEISHAFDNNGAKFDAEGSMTNWWTEEDYKNFERKTKEVIDQYEGLDFADGKVNGTLTVSENIADLGGLTCALESLKREDTYSLEDFFLNWARVWRQKGRDAFNQMRLSTDVHAPNYWRANMVPRNLDDFYETFSVTDGDNMYMAPEERIIIW